MAGSSGIAAMGIPNAIRGLWCSRAEPATHRGMTIPLTGTRAGRLSGFFLQLVDEGPSVRAALRT